jgi:hypothetical protein
MKKQLTILITCLAGILTLFPGCKKESTPPPPPPTKTQMISQSPWLFLSATANGADATNSAQLACFKDNVITFTANGNGTISEGAVICSPDTSGPFTWNFTTGETVLVLSAALFPGGNTTFNITTLNGTNLVVSQTVNFLPPPSIVTVTFKH